MLNFLFSLVLFIAGYVEDSVMPRLYRQSPLNAIWEGSGNVICLDLLRCIGREPDAVAALQKELQVCKGSSPNYDAALGVMTQLTGVAAKGDHSVLRLLASTIAVLLQVCALSRTAPEAVWQTFARTRLTPDGRLSAGPHYGQLDGTVAQAVDVLMKRARQGLDSL